MSTTNALAIPTRRRMISQGVKLVARPLTDFMGVPGIQEFVHNAQELVVALKAPGVNAARAEAIVSQIVNIAMMIGDTMERLEEMDNTVATAYLEKLRPSTEYLEQMKTEIDLYQQPGYATKVILQRDTAERLMQLENELRIHTLLLCLDTILLMGQTTAQTHQDIVQTRVQFSAFQAQAAVHHLETSERVSILDKEVALQKVQIAELCIKLDGRCDCIDVPGIHRSNFFLHPGLLNPAQRMAQHWRSPISETLIIVPSCVDPTLHAVHLPF